MQNTQNQGYQNVNEGIQAQVLMSDHFFFFFVETKQNTGGEKKQKQFLPPWVPLGPRI